MSKYRAEMEQKSLVETIASACPICHLDVKGDDVYLFYCKKCNILFKRNELALESKEHVTVVMDDKILKNYARDKGQLKIDDEHIPLKDVKVKVPKPLMYVASATSNVVHLSNCPFAKNIKRSNRKVFKSLEEAKEYKRCKCI